MLGRLMLAEILLTGVLPFIYFLKSSARLNRSTPLTRQFYIFVALWFLGALITDAIRLTAFEDFARGWSKILFFIINFTSISFLINRDRQRAVLFILLLSAASAVRLRMDIDGSGLGVDIFGSAWKFGYGQLFAEATLLLSAFLVSNSFTRLAGMSLPFLAAFINILLNARNLFGITALSGLAVMLTASRRRAVSPGFLAAMGIAGLFVAWALVSAYSYAASAGMLGVDAKDKYEMQASGSLGILLGGRSESIGSTQAIIDSPIIGHGSWARDIKYVELMMSQLEQAGYDTTRDPNVSDLIPSHSHLLGAWVESGILGAIFWVWVGWVTIRGLYAAIMSPTPLSGFVVFIGLSLLWDVLFSPFGLERRVITPACLILMMLMVESPQNGGKTEGRTQ